MMFTPSFQFLKQCRCVYCLIENSHNIQCLVEDYRHRFLDLPNCFTGFKVPVFIWRASRFIGKWHLHFVPFVVCVHFRLWKRHYSEMSNILRKKTFIYPSICNQIFTCVNRRKYVSLCLTFQWTMYQVSNIPWTCSFWIVTPLSGQKSVLFKVYFGLRLRRNFKFYYMS